MPKVIIAVLPLLLGGCVTSLIAASSGLDFDNLSFRKILGLEAEVVEVPVQGPLYCYETLGRGECYRQPVVGAEARLQGFVGPEPVPVAP